MYCAIDAVSAFTDVYKRQLYLQPAPGAEDIIPGAFPLYHAGNDFVRMPAGAAVIAVKLHDIAGVVHLQLRVLVEYLHRYFHRPCALVFGVLGHGQQRSVPAKLILFCKAVRRHPSQRQVRIADGRAQMCIRDRCSSSAVSSAIWQAYARGAQSLEYPAAVRAFFREAAAAVFADEHWPVSYTHL